MANDLLQGAQPATAKRRKQTAVTVDDGWPADYAEQFWAAVPRKVAKKVAMKALDAARRRKVPFATIMAGIARYAQEKAGTEPQYILHPATWLNGDRWEDEPAPPGRPRGPTLGDIARGRR